MTARLRSVLAGVLAAVACAACPCLARAAHPTDADAGADAGVRVVCRAIGSPLALATVVPSAPPIARGDAAAVPDLWLAQRSIEREWVAPGDSAAIANRLPGGKSEIGAALMSALLPGSGELYVGERSGFAFLAAEIAGVLGVLLLRRDAEDLRDQAERLAGAPTDSASAWSFERWAEATGGDPAELQSIYAQDPEAFWDRLARDPALDAGWSSGGEASDYFSLRSRANLRQRRSNQAGTFLWLNHLVSVADALRAARLHNLPLGGNLQLRANGFIKRGQPSLVVAVTGRF